MEICLTALCVLIVYFISRKTDSRMSEWVEILAAGVLLFLLLHS